MNEDLGGSYLRDGLLECHIRLPGPQIRFRRETCYHRTSKARRLCDALVSVAQFVEMAMLIG
eukprot:scaffold91466_cov26-Tisochrysis_lutea.AAC.1